mmetsp:Transcript_22121/g.37061  ORF Transcript_22121/g.37061 Transcript_22121/m.37061 type:complete len:120 (+) Transcript_22121:137-496(+)
MFSVKFLELAASVGLTQSPEDERRRPTSPKGDSTLETLGTVIKEVAESLVLDDDEDEEEEENQRPARLAPIQKPAERDQETTSVLVCSVVVSRNTPTLRRRRRYDGSRPDDSSSIHPRL